MKYNRLPKKASIQWVVLRQQQVGTLLTVATIILGILMLSLILSYLPWQLPIEDFLGFELFSITFYTILGIILFIGIIAAFFFTIYAGYPLGRELKKELRSITDGAEAFSRGRLDYRIGIEGFTEVRDIGKQFNKMADRIEKQVNTLQRLVDENDRLVNQTKITTALDERRRLARDLHDAVSQQLFAVSMTLSALPKIMETDREKAKQYFLQVEDMVVTAQQELRALIMHLRPVTLEGHSLNEGIEQLFIELKQKHQQINWKWQIDKDIPLSQGVENQIFRVVQEAISNMLRHSKATVFDFQLFKKQERIILLLEDNGVGFEINDKKKSSYGMTTMKERVEDIGGRFDVVSYPGKGTRVEIRVPIHHATQEE